MPGDSKGDYTGPEVKNMLNFTQCTLCKKPFQSPGGNVCHSCLSALDEDFVKVRDYIDANPHNHGMEEIVEATGVSKAHIMHLLREDRLQTVAPIIGGLVCQS